MKPIQTDGFRAGFGAAAPYTLIVHTNMFRLPASLLERARQEGAARGLAYVRSVEEALEVYFFSRLPPPMAEALEADVKALKVSRENYFYSLLDARYRELIAKQALRSQHDAQGCP